MYTPAIFINYEPARELNEAARVLKKIIIIPKMKISVYISDLSKVAAVSAGMFRAAFLMEIVFWG
jgi:hypothetical protein